MKKIYGFAFAASLLALASCSNDVEPVGPNNPTPDSGEAKYLAVNIVTPTATRGEEDYEAGTETENQVDDVKFVVLKQGTSGYEVSYVVAPTTSEWTATGNYNPYVEKVGQSVLIIPSSITDSNTEGADVSTVPNNLKLLVLLNYKTEVSVGTAESALLEQVIEVASNPTAGAFVMSSTGYKKDGTTIHAVELPHNKLFSTQEIAKANPVDVYVERVVARADINKSESFDDNISNNEIYWEYNSNPGKETLTHKIIGIAFYGDPKESYLFKNVEDWTTTQNENYQDAVNFRSYWATMPTLAADKLTTFSFNSAVNSEWFTSGWDGAVYKNYIRENTLGGEKVGSKATKVVVLTQLVDADGNAKDMANVFGQFTTKDGAAALVASTLKGEGYRLAKKDNDGKITEISTINYGGDNPHLVYSGEATKGDSYQVEDGDGNRTYLKFNDTKIEGYSFVKENGTITDVNQVEMTNYTDVEKSEIENKLKTTYAISYWNQGYCYFYTDILHFPVESKIPGVVRNHLYKVEFDGISGLGTPVFDSEKTIIPTTPKYDDSEKVFLSAKVRILKWRIVAQKTILGQ